MGLSAFTSRLATFLVLHAAGAGLASPALISRPGSKEYLPADNQTLYRLGGGEVRSLELNTSSLSQRQVYITISPCSRDLHWAFYQGVGNDHLVKLKERSGMELAVISVTISLHARYVLQLRSERGGAAAVSARGEGPRDVRMRLRVRSRRRLAANWEPSPIDPQATTYCVVASHRKNYTSLCAAQLDLKSNRVENPRFESRESRERSMSESRERFDNGSREVDNRIDVDAFNIYEGNFRSVFRRKKFGRSTASNGDPVVACVGDRTHHVIENLDPAMTYTVSIFGVARDRRSGSLLASGTVRSMTSTAKRLRENTPVRADVRGRTVYYFKTLLGSSNGIWVTLTSCGGPVEVEVLVRGKRLFVVKDVEPHTKFFVPTPIPNSSVQETSEEGAIQFDSSSEEAKIRYVIRVTPSSSDREDSVGLELTVSTTRWGVSTPELQPDGAVVRELRPRRSCRSVDVAFLPATHNATDVIRYCVVARQYVNGDNYFCAFRKPSAKLQCSDHIQSPMERVIIKKIIGLQPGTKYSIQVYASNKQSSVPYRLLYADTNASCKESLE